ncbi:hypothetical protein HW115_15810 [Verrucomicrobiaceae bacterium N1E253]|uniref:Uncharacterized protein n=1 Tax=Oceaniferula marina TaxID=2748318 RepID=A0A851GH23_9BACT|nr:hypothetical protein [Oceaniferula marina]NWK57088.1 hypothetical protein [Oceaniferula marina]
MIASAGVHADPAKDIPQRERMGAQIVKPNFNQLVLQGIRKMPKGGGYETSRRAAMGIRYSMVYRDNQLVVNARHAVPSYCSGATYLAFLYAVKEAERKGYLKLSQSDAIALLARGQQDGVGVWGRWNANGPGTAVFFHETGIGKNFESYQGAKPGDFMKIFWTDEIGKKEFGHSVIYLGSFRKDGAHWVKFWSSNQKQGYGEKSVPASKIKWAIFSRITDIRKVGNVDRISKKNTFLADMLTKSYSQKDVRKKAGMKSGTRRTFLGL